MRISSASLRLSNILFLLVKISVADVSERRRRTMKRRRTKRKGKMTGDEEEVEEEVEEGKCCD